MCLDFFELEIVQVKSDAWLTYENVSAVLPLLAIGAVMAATLFMFMNTSDGGGTGQRGPVISLAKALMNPDNPRVFLEVSIGDKSAGKVVVSLQNCIFQFTQYGQVKSQLRLLLGL